MKAVWGLLAVSLLTACATAEAPKSKEPSAQVTVYREPSTRDSLFPMLFSVDGRLLLRLYPGEEGSTELSAGEHRFEYELGLYNCSANVRVESGKTYRYRLAQGCVIAPDDEA
jgi:hypothetical protein